MRGKQRSGDLVDMSRREQVWNRYVSNLRLAGCRNRVIGFFHRSAKQLGDPRYERIGCERRRFDTEGAKAERDAPELATVTGMTGAHFLWALLRPGSPRTELFQYLAPAGKTTPPAQSDTGFTHLAFSVSDVDAIHDAAIADGHRPISAPQVMRGGVSRVFYLRGPEDIVVEFMEFADRRNA